MPGEFFLVGSFKHVPKENRYIGVVCKQQGKELTVLTVGEEATEWAILDWIKATVDLMRAEGREDVQAPDMFDRAQVAAEVSTKH